MGISNAAELCKFFGDKTVYSLEHFIVGECGTLHVKTAKYDFPYKYPPTIQKYRNSLFNFIFIPQPLNSSLSNEGLFIKVAEIHTHENEIKCSYSKGYYGLLNKSPRMYFQRYPTEKEIDSFSTEEDARAYVYNPITEIPNDLVWEFLLKGDCRSPWGSDMKYLFSLYQGENLGEEKSVLGEVDREKIPITGNSRFGCWCCTMVKEDKSLQNFINKGATELIPLREFRNELLRMRENSQYRDSKRRNGSVYKKSDGSFGMGPFTLEARCLILEKLLDLENRTGMELITEAELKAIEDNSSRRDAKFLDEKSQ